MGVVRFARRGDDEEATLPRDIDKIPNSHHGNNHNHNEEDDSVSDADSDDPHKNMNNKKNKNKKPMTQAQVESIAARENRAVLVLRILVVLVLAASAVTVAWLVYRYKRRDEVKAFETQYHSDAHKMLQAIGKTLDDTLGATDAFIVKVVSAARQEQAFDQETDAADADADADATTSSLPSLSPWPMVTIPDFQLQATKLLRQSKAFVLNLTPLVPQVLRKPWEQFVHATKRDMMTKSWHVLRHDAHWQHPVPPSADAVYTHEEIFGLRGMNISEPLEPMNVYLPMYHTAPIIPQLSVLGPVNFDFMQLPYIRAVAPRAYQTRQVYMTPNFGNLLTDPNDPQVVMAYEGVLNATRRFVPPGQAVDEPVQAIVFPVVDQLEYVDYSASMASANTADANDEDESAPSPPPPPASDAPVVAFLTISIFLRELIQGTLPSTSTGLLVVMSHECLNGQAFTYRVDGSDAIFLGAGDWHDSEFDYLEYQTTFDQLMKVDDDTNNYGDDGVGDRSESHYTGPPLAGDFCPRTVKIYPSQSMQDKYLTKQPLQFALLVGGIFVFVSLIFGIYDAIVARRQKIVLSRALASGAIVSSLFPEKVRNQLYQERKEQQKQIAAQKDFVNPQNMNPNDEPSNPNGSMPIAELYEGTTVFFADLAGFTKWSSTRSPVEVFGLLETLYGAYDEIARKRGVFKVETIGDCYVAVTGVPERQEKHAIIMVKFARDCMLKMRLVITDLVDTLGEDTAELEMRVGIHSGATTGGVLCGDKGRFQLFGDTVNTASRMESTGRPGMIHCSQATADELIAHGKEDWLVRREETVQAKGKGAMQTYFVNLDINTGTQSVRSFQSGRSDGRSAGGNWERNRSPTENAAFIQETGALGSGELLEERLASRLSQNTVGRADYMQEI